MKLSITTENKEEAIDLMNIDKYKAAIAGIENLKNQLDSERPKEIQVLYRGRMVPLHSIDTSKFIPDEKYLNIEDIKDQLDKILEGLIDNN